MENKYVFFINKEKAKECFDIDITQHKPIQLLGSIAVVWDKERGDYRDNCKKIIKKELCKLKNTDSCRIRAALHKSSHSGIKNSQNDILKDVFKENFSIKEYSKTDDDDLYHCFCQALSNDKNESEQAREKLNSLFEQNVYDVALELLTEWLPDFLKGTVPKKSDKWDQLCSDFERNGMRNEPLFKDIKILLEELKNGKNYDSFYEKYKLLYDKLAQYIER